MTSMFRTKVARAAAVGSTLLSVGGYMTTIPLVDLDSGGFSRFGYSENVESAKALHPEGRLPTPVEYQCAMLAGKICPPITLPHREQWPKPHMTEEELEDFRVAHMGSEEWARYHDALVRDWMVKNWDLVTHIASIGKHWCQVPTRPADWAALIGWWKSQHIWDLWQPLNDGTGVHRHNLDYRDYSSCCHVWTPEPLPHRPEIIALFLGQIEAA